jgi:hypothetical protein
VDGADHRTGKTGLSPTVVLSKNGGAFASPAGAVTEVANGWYKIAGNATDCNTIGPLILHADGTGADPTDMRWDVVDPEIGAAFRATITTPALQFVPAADLVKRALKLLGVMAAGETLEAEDASDGITRLNGIIDRWASKRWLMHVVTRTVVPLSANTASYTIGQGGAINLARITRIDHASVILDNTASPVTEIPIHVYTHAQWARVPRKAQTGTIVQGIYFDHAWTAGLGAIQVHPVPTVSTLSLVLYTPQTLGSFASLTALYSFPPSVEEALVFELARRVAPEYGRPWTPDLHAMWEGALEYLKTQNFESLPLVNDFPSSGRPYNILTDC